MYNHPITECIVLGVTQSGTGPMINPKWMTVCNHHIITGYIVLGLTESGTIPRISPMWMSMDNSQTLGQKFKDYLTMDDYHILGNIVPALAKVDDHAQICHLREQCSRINPTWMIITQQWHNVPGLIHS